LRDLRYLFAPRIGGRMILKKSRTRINNPHISYFSIDGIHTSKSILNWINDRNSNLKVDITKITLEKCNPWLYDAKTGIIRNEIGSFFSISGIQLRDKKGQIIHEQPVIIQDEIGFLGILCCEIDGVMHFLMQAKIEPGNVNKIQLSPTIQATKSNFTQKHGGKRPEFLDYFLNPTPESIIVDQIQSEQSSRFYKKRNRNVITKIDKPMDEPPTHRWMTIGQIKKLMRYDNIVNMDTRTVISCIPYVFMEKSDIFKSEFTSPILNSMLADIDKKALHSIFQNFNNYKMFNEQQVNFIDLFSLKNWSMKDNEFTFHDSFPFSVIFCDIAIEGREVKQWKQPLFKSNGKGTFGLLTCIDNNESKFLVKVAPEIGCFDKAELGPTVQDDPFSNSVDNHVSCLFYEKLKNQSNIYIDVMLSEEGGRFYHEENRNVIIEINKTDLLDIPSGYFWCNLATLNLLCQFNNYLNIQLRNLLSLISV
jgi:dTDP-4-dehydro-6-deoxy-alpha-D-glucopyranose 2,3-dehydratase